MPVWGARVPSYGREISKPNLAPMQKETVEMVTDWTKQSRRLLALIALALLLALSGVFGPVAFEQAMGGNWVSATHACGGQGSGC